MKYLKVRHRFFWHLPLLPFLYLAIVPFLILDLWVEVYHRIAYLVYGLPYEKRSNYIKIDRHKLKYLNPLQKLNCIYCGYANGVLQYWVKITGETEKYWCSIQHGKKEGFVSPPHHGDFIGYGDEEAYNRDYESQKTKIF